MLFGCTFALVVGGKIERVGAVTYLLCWFLSTLSRVVFKYEIIGALSVLALDIILLLTFAALVWKAPREWPVWACAFQALILASQLLFLTNFDPTLSAYFTIVNVSSLGIIVALVVGSFIAWQERRAIEASSNELGRYS